MPAEHIRFVRPEALPGVELLHVRESPRAWHVFNVAYAIATPASWRGDVVYRHRRARVGRGSIVLTEPGDPHVTPHVQGPGSFDVLFLDPELVAQAAEQLGLRERLPHWRGLEERRPELCHRLARLHRLLVAPAHGLEQQCGLVECVRLLLASFVERPVSLATQKYPRRSLERARDYIRDHVLEPIDLARLEVVAGLTRYHLVRAFKQAFGLPPHAYQSCARAWIARRLLHSGQPAAEVAADLGFCDQSHFIRTFKKFLGVTPSVYCAGRIAR